MTLILIFISISLAEIAFSVNYLQDFGYYGNGAIALNHETRECGIYWPREHDRIFKLPSKWKAYFPRYEKTETGTIEIIIETEIGKCNISEIGVERCCNELGYIFIGKENVGKMGILSAAVEKGWMCLVCWSIFILVIIVFIVLKKKTKSFVPFLKNYSQKGLFIGTIIGLLFYLAKYSVSSSCHSLSPFPAIPNCEILCFIVKFFESLFFLTIALPFSLVFASHYEAFIYFVSRHGFFLLLLFSLIGWIIGIIYEILVGNNKK